MTNLDVTSVEFKRLAENAFLQPMTGAAKGSDVVATEDILLPFGKTVLTPTGIAVAPPAGFSFELKLRSSLGLKPVILANSVGTIDNDYRGEIKAELLFVGTEIHPDILEDIDNIPQTNPNYERKTSLSVDQLLDISRIKEQFNQGAWFIHKGERVAQLVISQDIPFTWVEVDELDATERDSGGFGSTGK